MLAFEEAANGGMRDARLTCEVLWQPALRRHVVDQAFNVVAGAPGTVMHCVTENAPRCDAVSSTISCGGVRCSTDGVYDRSQVSERPVFYEATAKYFRELREARKLGFRQMVARAQAAKLTAITIETLRGLEKGKTKVPDANVLRDIARFYDLPYEHLAGLFVEHLYGLRVSAAGTATEVERPADESVRTIVPEPRLDAADMPETDSERRLHRRAHPYGLLDPAAARKEIERVASELSAIAAQLPRRQAAVARRRQPRSPARDRERRGQPDRAVSKKASGR